MAVEDPGTLTVTCDECGEAMEMNTTEYAGGQATFGVDVDTLSEHGWSIAGSSTFCPKCSEEDKDAS